MKHLVIDIVVTSQKDEVRFLKSKKLLKCRTIFVKINYSVMRLEFVDN